MQGILPDIMHISHLAVSTDMITSCLLDWSDDTRFFGEGSREKRLHQMFLSYRTWCETQGYDMAESAQKRLFSTATLKLDRYNEVSQKVLNAASCRYMIFWVADLAKKFAQWTQEDADMTLIFKL